MLAPQTAITRAKSPEAFRTISEVSAELDVPQHVLRFWESRFAQVKPVKRAGGRRYYRPEDVDLLRGIRALLYSDGFTIRGVQKILRDKGLRQVARLGRTLLGQELDNTALVDIEIDDDIEEPGAESSTIAEAQAGASVPMARLERDDLRMARRLAADERLRLVSLLDELLVLKSRLSAARASN